MALRVVLFCLFSVASAHVSLRARHVQDPAGAAGDVTGDVSKGEVPTAGEAVGKQTGVDVPNPHDYTGAIVGGGVAGTVLTLAIFCIATYMCYKWNSDMKEKGDEPYCGIMSCLCCCCCTPLVCCFPVDSSKSESK